MATPHGVLRLLPVSFTDSVQSLGACGSAGWNGAPLDGIWLKMPGTPLGLVAMLSSAPMVSVAVMPPVGGVASPNSVEQVDAVRILLLMQLAMMSASV